MEKLLTVLFLALSILFCSCDEKQEPVVNKSYRIARIEGDVDNYFESFEYNDKGLISRWENHYYEGAEKLGAKATYEYNDDIHAIIITAEDVFAGGLRNEFSDTLYLDERGIADRAKGCVVISQHSKGGVDTYPSVYYTADFQYDSLGQLTRVETSEKQSVFQGSLSFCHEYEWKDGNMCECTDYYNGSSQLAECKTTYSYYGGDLVDNSPILQYPVLRSFYKPLQSKGVFGKVSKDLIKEKTNTRYYGGAPCSREFYTYSYDLSTTMHDSWVEGYNIVDKTTGKEEKYTVSWEAE